MKISCDRFGKHHCQAVEDLDENDNETWCETRKRVDGEVVDGTVRDMTNHDIEKPLNAVVNVPKKYKKSTKNYSSRDADNTKRNGSLKFRGSGARSGSEVVSEPQFKLRYVFNLFHEFIVSLLIIENRVVGIENFVRLQKYVMFFLILYVVALAKGTCEFD